MGGHEREVYAGQGACCRSVREGWGAVVKKDEVIIRETQGDLLADLTCV